VRWSSAWELVEGRAIAQAVSRWLPTAVARVRVRAEQVGFVMDKVALGQVFSKYFDFSCQSSFRQVLHHHNHQGLTQCRVDPIGLHPQLSKFKKKNIICNKSD
jgi:hypothetical protein